jgi:hypothetical protein
MIGNKSRNRRTEFLPTEGLCVRVHTEEDALVVERVLLLCPGPFLDLLACRAHDGLDLSAVNETGNVGVGDLGGGQTTHTHLD